MATGQSNEQQNPGRVMTLVVTEVIGSSSADHIMASGQVPRKQAGHMTAPDRGKITSESPCNAGAVHT